MNNGPRNGSQFAEPVIGDNETSRHGLEANTSDFA